MSPLETLGLIWLLFTAALGHAAILVPAYKGVRRFLELSAKGELRERDEAFLMREERR